MKNLTKQEIVALLRNLQDGVIALSDGSRPYCIPVGYIYINDTVYFSILPTGRKWGCFQNSPWICFNIFSWNASRTEWSSVIIDGEMRQVTDLEEIESVVRGNIAKMGLDPTAYLKKRMDYYRRTIDSPKGVKIFKILAAETGGKRMRSTMGS